MVIPKKKPVVKHIRHIDGEDYPTVRQPDNDEPMEDVEESAPDAKMDKMESVQCEAGISIPHLPASEHRIATGDELKEYQAPIRHHRKTS